MIKYGVYWIKDTNCEEDIAMEKLITQFGVYLHGQLLAPYDTPEKAYKSAMFAYEETGLFHEVREIRQASKLDY